MVALALLACGRAAWAQACCAGGALVSPTRLAPYEDLAVGLQTSARTNQGAFDAAGRFASSSSTDQQFQEQLAASVRIAARDQAGALLPLVQTHRAASGLDEWGGGVGDLGVNYRHDFLLGSEATRWPGIALLAGATLPTGTAADEASNALATDATGAGTYGVSIGIGLEKLTGHLFAALNNWLTHRFARTAGAGSAGEVTQTFSLRWSAVAAAGYVFDSEAGLAGYVTFFDEGPSTIDGVRKSDTRLRQTTAGLVGMVPLWPRWRVQGALFADVMLPGFGRNQLGGLGATVSMVRLWF